MQFRLYTAAVGGSQLGTTIENAAAAVTDGVFSALLDLVRDR